MKKILLIEDESLIRRAARRMLKKNGYTVMEASSLSEAKRLIEENLSAIDIVVSDINLGDGNSTTLHAAMLPLLALHFIGWVSMTGGASEEERGYFTEHGVTVIEKSAITADLLDQAIQSAYKRA